MGERENVSRTRAEGESERPRTYERDVHPDRWSKLERIQFLLDHWSDIFEPNVASSLSGTRGGTGLDSASLAMAHHSSVLELDRCLGLLVERRSDLYRHLKAYRCGAAWRQVRAKVRVRLQSGRDDYIDGWKKERVVPSWISLTKVHHAEALVVGLFSGDVFIPPDLWNGLTKA